MNTAISDQVTITPRKKSFELEDELATLWHSGDPFKTAFFNALSMQFPKGEHNFIESVRAYRDGHDALPAPVVLSTTPPLWPI